MNKRQIIVGTAAAVFTLGSAGAAVALNLGAGGSESNSPAGNLVSTGAVGPGDPAATVTPSTVYIDVTVPELPPISSGSNAESTDSSGSETTGAGPGSYDDHDDGDLNDSHESENDHDDESDHPEGRDDDD